MFLPAVPELSDLLRALKALGVETHLQGYLDADGQFPFVDVCHEAATQMGVTLLSEFRLIYPSPISSEAILRGLPDPLQAGDGGVTEAWIQDSWHREHCRVGDDGALREQVSYLRQYGPSRLVRVEPLSADRLSLQIERFQAVLSAT